MADGEMKLDGSLTRGLHCLLTCGIFLRISGVGGMQCIPSYCHPSWKGIKSILLVLMTRSVIRSVGFFLGVVSLSLHLFCSPPARGW